VTPTPASLPFSAFLQVHSATGGCFSPDGRALAFLSNETGTAQAYRLDAPGAAAHPLTHFAETGRSVHWSPDGRHLLFCMDHGGSEREQLYLLAPDGSDCRPLTNAPEAVHTFGGWAPDSRRIAFAANRRHPAFFDLYTLDVLAGEERLVLKGDAYLNALDWSADGRRLLIRQHHAAYNQDLFLFDLESGSLHPITPHAGNARYLSAHLLPDDSVLLCTDQDRDFLALALLDPATGELLPLLEEPADIESCDVSRDGRRVAALRNQRGWSDLVLGRLGESGLTELVEVPLAGVASACRMAADGSRVAVTMAGAARNANVWAADPDTGSLAQWTSAATGGLDPSLLVEPEEVRYVSHDGLEIPAWLYRPTGSEGRPLTTVVHVHGGPESQDRPGYSAVYQYLVHRGYAVLAPNVRGSSGYGNVYCHLDDREKRYDALRDVEHAHRWLVDSGTSARGRIGIMGASYGGFTVLACLTRQPELWAAGVDIVGIANFETFFKHTGPYRRHLRASEYGDPERDAELLRDLSPIHQIDRIRAPLMVIQGANDPRVPQEESDQMVGKLRARGHPVEYLLFPDEGHGIVKLPNRVKAYTAVGEFLGRHLPP
jgi:dipeptidyl aminopeptidase/acylaminoacyl peptidase